METDVLIRAGIVSAARNHQWGKVIWVDNNHKVHVLVRSNSRVYAIDMTDIVGVALDHKHAIFFEVETTYPPFPNAVV